MSMSKSDSGKLGFLKSKETREKRCLERLERNTEEYNKNKKSCKYCNLEFEYEKRKNVFCNSQCSAKYNNSKKKIKYYCQSCEVELNKKGTYCSNACQLSKKRIDALNNNIASSKMAKTYLVKLHGAKCMECGWNKINPYTNNVPIELEHIDGNSSNNNLNNVKLLCPNCHSLTSTYKALNKGNGRHKRMKRYREGKSF